MQWPFESAQTHHRYAKGSAGKTYFEDEPNTFVVADRPPPQDAYAPLRIW